MTNTVKKVPLDQTHEELGAKMVDFAGWRMPIQYEGIIQEHNVVRNQAGLFDVSHMGEIKVTGENAFKFLQKILTNDLSKLDDQQIQYTMMCYPDGGVVDDLLVYRFSADQYILVVNAANIEQDYDWIKEQEIAGVEIVNLSADIAEVALQGPKAEEILQKLTDFELTEIKFFHFEKQIEVAGVETEFVSRTGYTGEDGFEIYVAKQDIKTVWDAILKAGGEEVAPVGLGARDTLRFEANLPLYGHEIGKDKNPLEAGLGYFVALDKDGFIGQQALQEIEAEGYQRKLVGLEMIDRGIPREGYQLLKDGTVIGEITTGSYAPALEKNIGLGYVEADYAEVGMEITVQIRRRECKAKLVELPFYKRQG
ncbi:glycine cleavage system aminomethyltransferase GcvT [Natroniella sulfidigena]|uniref:glycine cleavage system aminomethyltransferase GcvT n=1 Tax=Natroniella sulfidigena TaxID=723921 RepID=UPI00200B81BD|nr:glycine cleavage system aminomethyltransferase GcvT [Natroniella sulfidigena]MCK8817738.1 glycine cleavage system aminomethyltransferase GcvT [Natroniella sulfidigena]